MEDKKKKYLRIFKAEADEHLMTLSNGLLELEKGSVRAENIHDLFRAAHTLKGSSRMLGLEEIGAIAHRMEDIMKAVEEGKMKPDSEVVDKMLQAADTISKLLETEDPAEVDCNAILDALTQVHAKAGDRPPEQEKKKPAKKKKEKKASQPKQAEHKTDGPLEEVFELKKEPLPQEPRQEDKQKEDDQETIAAPKRSAETLRVDTRRLDRLIDLAGELLISKIKIESRAFGAKTILDDIDAFIAEMDNILENGDRNEAKKRLQKIRSAYGEFVQEFSEDVVELDLNVDEIQGGSLQLRMTPVSTLFDEFPRLVRDLSRSLDKQIALSIRGEDTDIDKRLLEQMRGPLVHLIRNACDHGIETPEERLAAGKQEYGTIHLRAYHHGGTVVIEVEDDGAGMDLQKIKKAALEKGIVDQQTADGLTEEEICYLTLMPGFSTSEIITDLSGRGVGLDVVKTNVEALRGDMKIESRPGQGTRIELQLPLTVSIIESLLLQQGGEIYALPLTAVDSVLRLKVENLLTDMGREAVPVRGNLLPLIRLEDLLKLSPLPGFKREIRSVQDSLNIIVLKFRNQKLALEVDRPMREQDILVKTLGSHIKKAPMVSGATILRKGKPALILNVFDIFAEAERMEGKRIMETLSVWESEQRVPRILVVDDSITTRTIEKNILERSGYEVVTAIDSEDALASIEAAEPMFDLFVVDVDMPGMDGFELTERIRQDARTKDLPVIICTSRASDEDKRKGISVGAQAYIIKGSFDQNVLLETVKSLIGE